MAKLVALQNAQISGEDMRSQIAERQASARKVADAEAKSAQIQQALHSATWDEKNGGLDEQTIRKIDAIDPTIGSGLRQHKQEWMTSAASMANQQSEAANRETSQQRQAREAAALVPPAEREYQAWRQAYGLPDNGAARDRYKVQGQKLTPGEVIAGAPGEPPLASAPLKPEKQTFEEQTAAAWLKDNPGKTLNDYQTMDANRKRGPEEGSSITPESLDMLATQFAKTGTLPALGMGAAAAGDRRRIFNRAAQLYPAIDVASNAADFAANKASETSLQKNRDAVVSFENTAGKNLDNFLRTAKDVIDSGSPWINTPLRSVAQKGLGSSDLAAFNAARQVAVNEIAKVTSNPGLSGQLSDSARREVEAFIPENATLKQIYDVSAVLKTDMKNRHDSMDEQLGEIQKRIKNSLPAGQAKAGNIPTNPATGKPYAIGDSINGHKILSINAKGPVLAQ